MKKKIIITLIVLLLVIAGVFLILYNFTNLLKSDKQLFWEYAVQNSDAVTLFNNDSIKDVKQKKTSNSYKQKSEVKIEQSNDLYKITADTNAENANNVFTSVKLEKNSDQIANINVIRKSNIVGFKMDELADGYITVKNSNLKELAKNMGVENVDLMPDSINMISYLDLLEISDEDSNYIAKKYSDVILSKTKKSNYKKLDNQKIKINNKYHSVDAYSFSLTETEYKELLSSILDELSKDSRTLNILSSKLKLMNLDSEQTSINGLSDKFVELSEKIAAEESSSEEYLEIIVYAENSKLVQTDLKFKDENVIKVNYDKENNKLTINQELLNKSNKYILSISDALGDALSKVKQVVIESNVSDEHSEIITNINITCEDNLNITYKSTTKITDDIEMSTDYDDSFKVVLNDMSQPQLQKLYKALVNNAKEIYNNKLNLIKNGASQDFEAENEEESEAEQNNVN